MPVTYPGNRRSASLVAATVRADAPPPPRRRSAVALLPASAAAAPPNPFGHACTRPERRALLPDRRRSPTASRASTASPLDVDVTLPPTRRRPVPDDRDAARLRRQQDGLRGVRARGRRAARAERHDLPLELQLLRAPRLRGRQPARRAASGAPAAQASSRTPRLRAAAGSTSPTSATRPATPSTCSACSSTRASPSPARSASPASPTAAARASSSAYLRDRIRKPDGSFAPWRSPQRHAARDRRRLPALAVVGPRQRAAAQRALPRLRASRARPRAASRSACRSSRYVNGLFALRRGVGLRTRRPGVDPGADLTTWIARARRRRALRRRRRARSPTRSTPTTGLRPPGHAGAAAAARRLDRRPLPVRRAAARLQRAARARPAARRSRCSSPTSATRAARNKVDADEALNDAGRRVPRRATCAARASRARAGQRDRLHADLPEGRARRRAVHGGELAPRCTPARSPSASAAPQTVQLGAAATRRPRTALDPIGGGGDAVHEPRGRERAGHRRLQPASAASGYTLLGLPTVTATIETDGRRRPARGAPVGRRPGRQAAARHARRLPADRRPARADRRSSSTATATASRRGHAAAARAARPRRALLPREQRLVQRQGLRPARRAAGRRGAGLGLGPRLWPGRGAPPPLLQALGRKRPRLSVRVRLIASVASLRTRGRLILPRGVSRASAAAAAACRSRSRRASARSRRGEPFVRHKTCRFSSKVRFRHRSRFGKAKRLTVRVRYGGNAALTPAKAPPACAIRR